MIGQREIFHVFVYMTQLGGVCIFHNINVCVTYINSRSQWLLVYFLTWGENSVRASFDRF